MKKLLAGGTAMLIAGSAWSATVQEVAESYMREPGTGLWRVSAGFYGVMCRGPGECLVRGTRAWHWAMAREGRL